MKIAVTDALIEKGGAPVSARPQFQDFAMLKVAERPTEGKTKGATVAKFHTVSSTRKASLWLDEQVASANGRVTAQIVTLTPELAAVLMDRNDGNRRIKEKKVADFINDIAGGSWKLNGEPIIVASDGLLNDGQHRCKAVIDGGRPIETMLVIGVGRETRDTLDQGIGRSPADYLSLHGHINVNNLAAAARMLWQWRAIGYVADSGKNSPTRSELVKVADENPGLVKSLGFVDRTASRRSLSAVSTLAFCHFAFKSVANEIDANYFMDALIEGADLPRTDPILYVRNRLIAERMFLSRAARSELLFKAWNAHRLGQPRERMVISGGELPLLEA